MPGMGGIDQIYKLSPYKRRMCIEKFIDQQQKEQAAIEKMRKK